MTFDEWYAGQKHQLSNEQVCRVIWDASAREEREACAKICDVGNDSVLPEKYAAACRIAASLIRQRSTLA